MTRLFDVEIGGCTIGSMHRPFIVAELSGNHDGSLEKAHALIDAVKVAGADAVKLQTFTPDTITLDCAGPGFVVTGGLWKGRRLYDLYQEAHTPWAWHAELFEHARACGLVAFSTPFDLTSVDFLEELNVPAYKIASFELIDTPLISRTARTGKPLIISTGMASESEIRQALDAAGQAKVILLHCVSEYPTPFDECHLRRLTALKNIFTCPVGLSDHSLGTEVAAAAVALGAVVVEKHVTLDRSKGGVDAGFSLEPHELARLVKTCRDIWSALGSETLDVSLNERQSKIFRRSLYVAEDIAQNEVFSLKNIRSVRPGYGLPPRFINLIVGRKAARRLSQGTPLSLDDIDPKLEEKEEFFYDR